MDEKYRYLNLQEQVGKNKHDIEELRTVKFNLERAGVRVVGEEASASDLPDPVTYTGQLGDAYLIGTEAPFDMYIYTQPSVGETNFKWFNIGAFPALGPQGEQGPEGPRGPQGDASNWRFGTVNPAILDTDREHDGYLNTTTGMVFEFSGTNWIPIGSIQGPRGNQGPIGPQGPTGRTGAQGNQGPQGPAGVTIEIIGVVDTVGSLPDPSTVSRNAGYILESGDDKNLYIIVEDENQDLTWYDAGAFSGVPGTAAGFGTISATVTPITPGTAPSVTVTTSGTNEAKNIAFAFSLPVGAELENTAASTPSETKGYTQKVIDQKTMDFVIKKPSDLGFTDGELPVSIFDVMQKITAQYTDMDIVIINESANENIKDAPSTIGQLFIRTGKGGMTPLAMWVDNVYNVHLFYGIDGNTPANPVWYRIMTTKDAAGIGTPAGGTTGQLLAKRSDEDFDTVWKDVPNAPNGIPAGGTTGKILVKKSGTDYDTEWQTKPTGIPNGGTTGQIIKKQSGNDGDVAWANAPVGLPSGGTLGKMLAKLSDADFDVGWQTTPIGLPAGGTTGQVLKKIADQNYAANWRDEAVGIPSGGTTGQVLQKTSGTDYDVEWATPAAGGGGGPSSFGKNYIINPDFSINQRGTATINTAAYGADRWYVNPSQSGGNCYFSTSGYTRATLYNAKLQQAVEINTIIPGGKYIVGVTYQKTQAAGNISISISSPAGTAKSLDASKTITSTFGGSTFYQAIGIFDPTSLLLTTVPSASYFWFEIEGAANQEYSLVNAFCHLVDSATLSDLPDTMIPVQPVNNGEELGKCKYYYENLKKMTVPSYGSITQSGTTRDCIYAVVECSRKRITPTKGTVTLRVYQIPTYNGTTSYSIDAIIVSNETKYIPDYMQFQVRGYDTPHNLGIVYGQVFVTLDAEIYPS